MKFKVGDKVKILWEKTPYCYCSTFYTDKGEIVEVFEKRRMFRGNYVVRVFNKTDPLYQTSTFKEDELILLEEETNE